MLTIRCTPHLIQLLRERSLDLRVVTRPAETLLVVERLGSPLATAGCTHLTPDDLDSVALDLTHGLLTLEACLAAAVDSAEKL